jgi:hypothetical protein
MRASLGVSLGILLVAASSSFACLSPDERDLDEVGGAAGVAGSTGASAGAGAAAGSAGTGGGGGSSGSGGATGGGAGGGAGQASGGTGMISGSGGVAGSNAAGTAGAGSGATGGSDPGTGGSNNGGSINAGAGGSSDAGAGGSNNGGSNTAGGGGSNSAGVGGSGTAGSAGTGNCVPNYDCELEPPPTSGDPYQDCVDRINQFRAECACLPPLERWTEGEDCADQMAEYDSTRSAHAGFADNICEGGSAQNECPGWGSNEQVVDGCLQAMWSEGPPPQEPCEGQCFQDHGHFINMTNERYGAVACGFYETSDGEVWAVQNFTR